ncbi:MAG: MoaD/ThiS family protein [Oscillospiraceae bacterium]|nr:MoaD/ThiS family protein [Oscillospiraceae bacterium]
MVTVKLFGTLRLDSGIRELTAEADSIRALYPLILAEIREQKPDCGVTEKTLHACLVAVNGKQVSPRAKLRDGDTVYLFPAVAGG